MEKGFTMFQSTGNEKGLPVNGPDVPASPKEKISLPGSDLKNRREPVREGVPSKQHGMQPNCGCSNRYPLQINVPKSH